MKRVKEALENILGNLLDYGPIIATVLLATFASLAAIRKSITTQEMLQWILGLVALLATTLLVDRFRVLRGLNSKVEKLVESTKAGVGANAFLSKEIPNTEEVKARLRKANSISISGITLARTSGAFWTVFKERLEQGAEIRLLVVDPEHKEAIKLSAFRFEKLVTSKSPAQLLKGEITHALDNFKQLRKQTATNRFQVRVMPFNPPYGIWLIDSLGPNCEVWVELYVFRADRPEPTFHLLPYRDGEWLNFFQEQFEKMWEVSRPWNLE